MADHEDFVTATGQRVLLEIAPGEITGMAVSADGEPGAIEVLFGVKTPNGLGAPERDSIRAVLLALWDRVGET